MEQLSNTAYITLGLQPGASREDVRKAYKKMILKYHPDHNRGREEWANSKFLVIQDAQDLLIRIIDAKEQSTPATTPAEQAKPEPEAEPEEEELPEEYLLWARAQAQYRAQYQQEREKAEKQQKPRPEAESSEQTDPEPQKSNPSQSSEQGQGQHKQEPGLRAGNSQQTESESQYATSKPKSQSQPEGQDITQHSKPEAQQPDFSERQTSEPQPQPFKSPLKRQPRVEKQRSYPRPRQEQKSKVSNDHRPQQAQQAQFVPTSVPTNEYSRQSSWNGYAMPSRVPQGAHVCGIGSNCPCAWKSDPRTHDAFYSGPKRR